MNLDATAPKIAPIRPGGLEQEMVGQDGFRLPKQPHDILLSAALTSGRDTHHRPQITHLPSHQKKKKKPTTPRTPKHSHLAFHLTLPTHPTHLLTSSLPASASTLAHSRANSSLPATPCTKL